MGRRKTNPVHDYVEFDLESNKSTCLIEGCDAVITGNHSTNLLRHFSTHHPETYEQIMLKNDTIDLSSLSPAPPKPKKLRLDTYQLVKRYCVELVKVHGRPMSLFDDAAFKKLISLIPISSSDQQRISSKGIAKAIAIRDEKNNASIKNSSKVNSVTGQIKGEKTTECTCHGGDEDTGKHTFDCAAQQPYFNYFEVEVDMATCCLCKENISWSSGSDLKEHLLSRHSTVPFKDDDEEFEKGAPEAPDSSIDPNEDVQEVYVEENILHEAIRSSDRTRHPQQTSQNHVISREPSSSWTSALDRFGLYVSALMKFLPRDKCIKFQSQIVQRLLQEQATAA